MESKHCVGKTGATWPAGARPLGGVSAVREERNCTPIHREPGAQAGLSDLGRRQFKVPAGDTVNREIT